MLKLRRADRLTRFVVLIAVVAALLVAPQPALAESDPPLSGPSADGPTAAPANDAFTSGQVLSGPSGSVTGSNVEATKETGEPDHAGDPGGASVWYRWTAPAAGSAQFSTAGSNFDTTLAVYTGSSVSALNPVASNDEFGGDITSAVTFTVTAGTEYRIAVDGFSADKGSVVLGWSSGPPPANDAFANGQVISGSEGTLSASNVGATIEAGEPDHAGFTGGSSIWYRWTAPATGPTTINTVGSSFDTLLGVYTGSSVSALTLKSSDDQSGGSDTSALLLSATAGTEYHIAVDGYFGVAGSVVLNWSQAQPAPAATVAVTSPNGGESWAPGSTQSVTWNYGEPAVAPSAVEEAPSTTASDREFDTVAAVAEDEGTVRAVVGLNVGFRPEGKLPPQAVAAQRRGIDTARDRVLQRLRGSQHDVARSFETVPAVVLELSPAAVERLRGTRDVASIVEDQLANPTLVDSAPLVEAPQAWDAGVDGSGQVVAVLDTGVQADHPFLAGKVVEEACYSAESSCPNGATSQTGAGAGAPCTYATACDHGTHVAGIVAGAAASFSGVGRGAPVMAVQVFSRFDTEEFCGTGVAVCTLSWDSDQTAGLERVYLLRDTHSFAAVNMSLGGGRNTSHCDAALQKPMIDNLRSVGIATVIASGNDGYSDAMGSPGCISSAVSVGSTTKADTVSSFSNSVSFLSLLAPGSGINSSVTGGGFGSKSGTSMATPHVAGAWAVLKQYQPDASVDQILAALQSTGEPVTDSDNGVTKPRIRVNRALLALDPRVDIHLLKAGSVVATIAEDVPATAGTFNWSIPAGLAPASDYRVRVTEVADPRATDTSNANFTVGGAAPADNEVADFDGNGTTDKAVYRPSTGEWFVAGGSPLVTTWGVSGDVPVPGDYDGDGDTDKAVYRPSTGQWFVLGGSPAITSWGGSGDVPVPGDYDGDGDTDKAIYRPSTGQWFVLGGSPAITSWGGSGDVPVPGDYDGDGDTDKAIYRPSNGRWYVLGGSPAITSWGGSGDVPVPGDYDGDGDTDKAIYRPSNGRWYVLGGSPAITSWGSSGDVPVPGDYDGDGDTDKAIYRPSKGRWYVLGGSPAITSWGVATDITLPLPYAVRRVFFP